MKFKGAYLFSFLVVFLVAGAAFLPYPPKVDKESVLIQTILAGVNQLHYSPKEIDNNFSEKVFDLYLDRLDGGRRWLTQKDLDQLQPYRHDLDDESLAGTYQFFDKSVKLVEASLEKTKKYYKEILAQPFDFTKDENIELDGDKKPFAQDLRKAGRYEAEAKRALHNESSVIRSLLSLFSWRHSALPPQECNPVIACHRLRRTRTFTPRSARTSMRLCLRYHATRTSVRSHFQSVPRAPEKERVY